MLIISSNQPVNVHMKLPSSSEPLFPFRIEANFSSPESQVALQLLEKGRNQERDALSQSLWGKTISQHFSVWSRIQGLAIVILVILSDYVQAYWSPRTFKGKNGVLSTVIQDRQAYEQSPKINPVPV